MVYFVQEVLLGPCLWVHVLACMVVLIYCSSNSGCFTIPMLVVCVLGCLCLVLWEFVL